MADPYTDLSDSSESEFSHDGSRSSVDSQDVSSSADNSAMSISSSSDDELLVGHRAGPSNNAGPTASRARGGGGRVGRARVRGGRYNARGLGTTAAARRVPAAVRVNNRDFRQGWGDAGNHMPQVPAFTSRAGNNNNYLGLTFVEVFQLFFTQAVWELLVDETNRYATQVMTAWTAARCRGYWEPVNVPTMKAFVALILTMGVVSMPRYYMYWSVSRVLRHTFFPSVMSRKRFMKILRFFHVADNTTAAPNDKLAKVRPFLNKLIPRFREVYTPTENLSPDESMIAFKGRLGFIQYMPLKPIKWGIKVFALCESSTGYTVNLKVYTGREDNLQQNVQPAGQVQVDPVTSHPGPELLHASGRVVMELVEGLQNKGYKIYCDNFYTSPALFRRLTEKGFGACGTVRSNTAGLPEYADPKVNKLKKGEDAQYKVKNGQLLVVWHDKKQVTVLSTLQETGHVEKRMRTRHEPTGFRTVRKPHAIQAYNQHMGGVDLADQYFQYYSHTHRSSKWWKRTFFHLTEVSLLNAFIVFKEAHPTRKLDLLHFRLGVIEGLLQGWTGGAKKRGRQASRQDLPERITRHAHFMGKVPGGSKPDCIVCSDRPHHRRQTIYLCKNCDRPMCPVPCFELYHTKENYRQRRD